MRKSLVTLLTLGALLAACGPGEAISLSDVWARSTAPTATNGAVYLTMEAAGEDVLLGASIDPAIAADAQVHETVMTPPSTESGDTSGGMGEMSMQEVDRVELHAGEQVSFEPGGYHIMLFDLVEPLITGSSFELTLHFENAGDVVTEVAVRDDAP